MDLSEFEDHLLIQSTYLEDFSIKSDLCSHQGGVKWDLTRLNKRDSEDEKVYKTHAGVPYHVTSFSEGGMLVHSV